MLSEYRYQGVSTTGKGIQGIVSAHTRGAAKKQINELALKHKIKINSISKKRTFLYTVKLPSGKKNKRQTICFYQR
jgi:type IV pilus assembly protein PilC